MGENQDTLVDQFDNEQNRRPGRSTYQEPRVWVLIHTQINSVAGYHPDHAETRPLIHPIKNILYVLLVKVSSYFHSWVSSLDYQDHH